MKKKPCLSSGARALVVAGICLAAAVMALGIVACRALPEGKGEATMPPESGQLVETPSLPPPTATATPTESRQLTATPSPAPPTATETPTESRQPTETPSPPPPTATATLEPREQAVQLARQVDVERLMADVRWLADDARAGRRAGTAAEDEVAAWLGERLQQLGLRPFEEAGLQGYTQPFPSTIEGAQAENVIGVLPGAGPFDRYILLCAHYDHVGTSLQGEVYNGADDDASGVAAVLEAARILSRQRPQATIVFVLFSEEESGGHGSMALGDLLTSRGLSSRCLMLNLEVLGAAKGQARYLSLWDEECAAAAPLVQAIKLAAEAIGFPVQQFGRDPGSDATRMLGRGVPAACIDVAWDGGRGHPYYHKPTDDAENIDQDGLLKATQVAVGAAWLVAQGGE